MSQASSTSAKFRGRPVDVVIDVRSKLEFWLGHLPGAVNIPVDRIPDGLSALKELSPSSRILVYCASGARSRAAAQLLESAGYTRVVDGGGMSEASAHFTT